MKDCRDTPDTLEVIYEFLDSCSATHPAAQQLRAQRRPGATFRLLRHPPPGTLGTLFVDRAGYQIIPQMTGHSEKISQSFREAFDDLSGMGCTTRAPQKRTGTTSLQHFPHVRNFSIASSP